MHTVGLLYLTKIGIGRSLVASWSSSSLKF